MKRTIKYIVCIIILWSISIYFIACGKNVQEKRVKCNENASNDVEVYRISYDEFDCDFKNGDYLAVEQSGKTLYIPDCYGEILNVSVKESSVVISHIDLNDNQIKENTIPITFLPKETGNVVEITSGRDKRVVVNWDTEKLPLLIWKQEFVWENKLYEIAFERTSLVYRGLFSEYGDLLADYHIKVLDEYGGLISEQLLTNFPVQYEELYWLTDFSGDGFPDLAFCTQYLLVQTSSTTTHFFIWDVATSSYQQKLLPRQNAYHERIFRPLWNTELSTILCFVGSDKERMVMQMYLFSDNEWNVVRKLEPVYKKNEHDEAEIPQYIGYREIFYENDEIISQHMVEYEGVNAIWFDKDSVWCKDNVENIQLYPGEEWQEITIHVDGIVWKKYVRSQNS